MLHYINMYKENVTKQKLEFLEEFPYSAKEALFTPIIYRFGLPMPESVPFPTLNGIRDLSRFAGVSDTAIRTALSRAKADGSILEIKDDQKKTHYTISQTIYEMGMTSINREKQADGFIVAVYSFTKDAENERVAVRDTLKNYGFKRLAQNTYINGRIDTKGLLSTMKKLGLEKHLYLFHCPNIDDPDLINKILNLFEMDQRKLMLDKFYSHMIKFLGEQELSDDDLGRRLLYFGAIYWTVCEFEEPPIPAIHWPPDYPLLKIKKFYHDFIERNNEKLINYYIKVNT